MNDMEKIAVNADMIVDGYAFTRIAAGVQAVNLERGKACVIDENYGVIETSMDDIELGIVVDYYKRNKKFMEAKDA